MGWKDFLSFHSTAPKDQLWPKAVALQAHSLVPCQVNSKTLTDSSRWRDRGLNAASVPSLDLTCERRTQASPLTTTTRPKPCSSPGEAHWQAVQPTPHVGPVILLQETPSHARHSSARDHQPYPSDFLRFHSSRKPGSCVDPCLCEHMALHAATILSKAHSVKHSSA